MSTPSKRLRRRREASLLEIATGRYIRGEKEEERRCDKAVLACGGTVIRFSQARATQQTPGIPDRRFRVRQCAFWFEVKAADGKLTKEQYEFLTAEIAAGEIATVGTSDDLIALLEHIPARAYDRLLWRPTQLLACTQTVEAWRARGFRTVATKGAK